MLFSWFFEALYNIPVDLGKVLGSLPPILEAAAMQKKINEILISKYFPMSYCVLLSSWLGVVRLVANYVLVGACVSSFWYLYWHSLSEPVLTKSVPFPPV